MQLVRDEACVLSPGDFGARVVGATLHIPTRLHDYLQPRDVRSATDFYSFVHNNPAEVEITFQWSQKQVATAIAALRILLTGHVHPAILSTPPQPRRIYGAQPPSHRRTPK